MSRNLLNFDILNPSTFWIGQRCYRVLTPIVSNSNINYAEEDSYQLEDNIYKDEIECKIEDDLDFPMEHLPNGKVKTSFHVASAYLSYIIGSKGATKNRIEDETRTSIRIPPKGMTGDVVIIGKDIRTVRQARLKVQLLVQQARKKQSSTHFLSMPLNVESIQKRFIQFKESVLEKFGSRRGVDPSLFQDPKKLHLTLGVFVLVDDRERLEAVDALKAAHPFIMSDFVCDEPIRVEVKGVSYMNDDPGEMDVLYGDVSVVSWTHDLQQMCDDLLSNLRRNTDLAPKQYDRVKLHVTLMNSAFRRGSDAPKEERLAGRKERESFDGRDILQEYSDYSFGEMELSELHLSVRFTSASNGYYSSSIKLSLLPHR